MSRQYSQIQRLDVINRYFSGDGVNTLSEETGVSRSTIYNWIKAERRFGKREQRKKEPSTLSPTTNSRNMRSGWRGC